MNKDLIDYQVTDDGIVICGYRGDETELALPEQIEGLPVVALADEALTDKGLTQVTLPVGLKTIGREALAENQLSDIVLPPSLVVIGRDAFYKNALRQLEIPAALEQLGEGAFCRNQIQQLTIKAPLAKIPSYCFAHNALTELSLPPSVSRLDDCCFDSNEFVQLTIPPAITRMAAGAFAGLKRLEQVSMDISLAARKDAVFRDCDLSKITFHLNHSADRQRPVSDTLYYCAEEAAPHLCDWGLACFSDQQTFGRAPLGVYLRDNVVVGLEVSYDTKLNAQARKQIAAIETLELLECRRLKGFSNGWLAQLARLPRLTQLGLPHTSLNDSGLEKLSASASLQKLDISGCHKITEPGYAALGRLSQLKTLVLTAPKSFDFSQLRPLNQLKNLISLTIKRNEYVYSSDSVSTDDMLAISAGLTQLRYLNLDYVTDSYTGLDFLNQLPALERLSLQNSSLDEGDICALIHGPELRELDISYSYVFGYSNLNRLLASLRLEQLGCSGVTLYDADEEPLEHTHITTAVAKKSELYDRNNQLMQCFLPQLTLGYPSVTDPDRLHWGNGEINEYYQRPLL